MSERFSLGIEEEFQLVNRTTGALCSCAQSILERGTPYFAEHIKPEMLQSTIEYISDVLPNIEAARRQLASSRALLSRVAEAEGLALVSAGTHPSASWRNEKVTEGQRYEDLQEEYQDVGRSILIFGLHVHVGLEDKELAMKVMNQVRTWLPQILAFSTNSPFWSGRMTGIKSYRSVVWKRFPRSGTPDIFPTRQHFDQYVQHLVDLECIDNGKKIWWDIRPHPFFDTLEFRLSDMPGTLADTLAIAALCQALVAKLTQLNETGQEQPVLPRDYIDENKWRAMRYGLDSEFLDFPRMRTLSMRDALRETLAFVDDVVDDLGSRREMNYIAALLDDPRGTGADQQIALYEQTGDPQQVQQFLVEQALLGIETTADHSASALRFRMPAPTS